MFSICFSCSLLGSSRRGSCVGAVMTIRDRLLCSITWNPVKEERGAKASVEHSCCCGFHAWSRGKSFKITWLCPGNDPRRKSPEDPCQNSRVMSFLHSVRNKVHKWEKWNNWSSLSLKGNWQKAGAGDFNALKCSWKPVVLKKCNTGKGSVFSTAICGKLEGAEILQGMLLG